MRDPAGVHTSAISTDEQQKVSTLSSSKDSPSLPSGTDPENALILRTTRGDVIVALRHDIAPVMPSV